MTSSISIPLDSVTSILDLAEQLNKVKDLIRQQGKAAFETAFASIFKKHPTLEAIRWRQYTPYFNDGDTCEFGVNDFEVKTSETSDDKTFRYNDDGFVDCCLSTYAPAGKSTPVYSEAFKAVVADVKPIRRQVDEDMFEIAFGDHVEVNATRTDEGVKIEVDGYDHE